MLELTKRIKESGLQRFWVGLYSGVNPNRIETIDGRFNYSEIDCLGKYFGINGYELLEETKEDVCK